MFFQKVFAALIFSLFAIRISYGFNEFDVQICEAYADDASKVSCYSSLVLNSACKDTENATARLFCYQQSAEKMLVPAPKRARQEDVSKLPVNPIGSSVSQEQICKDAIAAIMGQSPTIISITKTESGVVYLNYVRQNDGSRWSYRCKLEGDRVIWASETGRWRTDGYDDKITHRINDNSVEIIQRFSDGSSSTKTFIRDRQEEAKKLAEKQEPTKPSNSQSPSSDDVREANNFLSQLPPACSNSYSNNLPDGTVSIRIICSGNNKSVDGLVEIKNGIVKRIR